jgi:hypothetical protein
MADCFLVPISVFRFCRLQGKVPVVRGISLPGQTAAEISAQTDLETKTVEELVGLNIWDHKVGACNFMFWLL